MGALENIKLILDIETIDTSKDSLLNLYISRATNYIKNELKVETVPDGLLDVIEDMAVFQYRQKGVENISSEGKGSLSESYITEYPPNIMNQIHSHRKVRVL